MKNFLSLKTAIIFFASTVALFGVTLASYIYLDYKDQNEPIDNYVKQVAGKSIVRASKIVNPSKEEKRYVSVLIMGIDTRGVEFNGKEYVPEMKTGTRKIDVIMQVLYDRQENKVTFISIPRDTSLPVTEECMHQEKEDQKYINRIYDMAEKNNCPQSGPEMMMKYVSYITGYEIDYYTIFTFDTFVDLVAKVGQEENGKAGIWLDIPKQVSDYCPNKQYGYNYVYFPVGRQFLTPDQALCYIRVRKTSNDFDRNRRQQLLINELLKQINQNESLKNPVELYDIFKTMKADMQMSEIDINDITMGIEVLSEIDLDNVQKIVLDDSFGGTNALLTKPRYSKPGTHTRSGYYLIPTAWDQDCCKQDEWKLVRSYLHQLIENPDSVTEQALIYAYPYKYTNGKAVYDSDNYKKFKASAEDNFVFIQESKYSLPMRSEGSDIQIYDFTSGQKPELIKKLKSLYKVDVYDGKDAPFKPINNEEISIIVRVN